MGSDMNCSLQQCMNRVDTEIAFLGELQGLSSFFVANSLNKLPIFYLNPPQYRSKDIVEEHFEMLLQSKAGLDEVRAQRKKLNILMAKHRSQFSTVL